MTDSPILWQGDWLGLRPLFYNRVTGRYSAKLMDVVDFDAFDWSPSGLRAYLECGYCALRHTPVRDVLFLGANETFALDREGRPIIGHLEDPALAWLERTTNERALVQYMEHAVHAWEHRQEGTIVVPTSGGYDSRMLNLFLTDPSRAHAFTYGISSRQERSFETVYARTACERLGIRWDHVPLGNYHAHLDEWDNIFGPATHAHGMYHMEFYDKIRLSEPTATAFLSGIIGDGFAGKVRVPHLRSPSDVKTLFLTHGLNADAKSCLLPQGFNLFEIYFEEKKRFWEYESYRILELLRNKLMLLRYLFVIPEHYGFQPWSPFLDVTAAMGMLQLPSERRHNRRWQKELFRARRLDLEAEHISVDYENTLNLQAQLIHPVPPLDARLLGEIIRPDYVEWCNTVLHSFTRGNTRLSLEGVLKAYNAYLTLRPLERLIQKRDATLACRANAAPSR